MGEGSHNTSVLYDTGLIEQAGLTGSNENLDEGR